MNKSQEIVLGLLKMALGHSQKISISDSVNWQEVMDIAAVQGVLGVCFDAFALRHAQEPQLSADQRPDIDTLMDWLGQVSYMEELYEQHKIAICDLASFQNSIEVRMMLLKGYGLSKYYPVPKHRPVGDMDVYLFDLWEYADQMVHDRFGIEVGKGHHHHSVFTFHPSLQQNSGQAQLSTGVTVENHYDFINTKDHKSSSYFEYRFKQLAREVKTVADGEIENLYYPCADLNALFLLKHMALHFSSTEITLRQLLDWLFFC